VETALLEAYGAEIAERMGDARVLVEFGSGSSRKTSLLLSALAGVTLYVPIDVAGESLAEAAEWLSERHDGLAIRPLIADFTTTRTLPVAARRPRKLGFFSGSTIGNLTQADARAFLANAARLLGRDAAFLVGVDLKKDPSILIPAYNDRRGVTAAFNLNLLERINRELDGDIDVERFEHLAFYNAAAGRMELYLKSLAAQAATIAGRRFQFAEGERVHTENSYKYAIDEFRALAARAGFATVHTWTDRDNLFSVHYLRQR
jgi:dimethylhistidine N-methyltransferase